jgi:hypothetical protein
MLEPDVALTDFALAAQCAALAVVLLIRRSDNRALEQRFAALFSALAVASFLGGTWHAVFSGPPTDAGRWVWLAAMVALALAAACLWFIAAMLVPSIPWAERLRMIGICQVAGQITLSGFATDAFAVGAIGILPGLFVLMALYLRIYMATRKPLVLIGLSGLALTALSGLVIAFGITLHPRWATPNAVYHVLEFLAFWLVFLSIPALCANPRNAAKGSNSSQLPPSSPAAFR